MRTSWIAVGLAGAGLLLSARTADCGVCIEAVGDYVACLEDHPGPAIAVDSVRGCLECLRHERHSETGRWAGPITAEYFRSLRESPLRARIIAACEAYLDGEPPLQSQAACTLARYGVGNSGVHDVFALVIQAETHTKWVDLAALGDARTADYILATYRQNRPRRLKGPGSRWMFVSMANCLYHIPGERSVEVARELLAAEDDSELMERLRHVIGLRTGEPANRPLQQTAPRDPVPSGAQ